MQYIQVEIVKGAVPLDQLDKRYISEYCIAISSKNINYIAMIKSRLIPWKYLSKEKKNANIRTQSIEP